jgi:peptide deformylase
MILPIVAYGHPILRKECDDIDENYPDLKKLIDDMWETLYHSNGVGLAAPQVNHGIRLFLVETKQLEDAAKEDPDHNEAFKGEAIKQVFINPEIVETGGTPYKFNEGCLSIPKVREDITRDDSVTINYLDENFEEHEKTFDGMTARVILHEYDHIEGVLFIDYLSALKRKILKGKLNDISKGRTKVDYRMLLP